MSLMLAGATAQAERARSLWVTAYYPGWRQSRLAPRDIDFEAMTHVAHFSVVPRADGSLDSAVNMLTPENVRSAVSAAYAAGKKILVTVGGQNTRERFEGAMSAAHRASFIAALVGFMRYNGYDGIDVDMEDIPDRDVGDYAQFIRALRAKLDEFTPRPLLTAAVLWQPDLFARLSGEFDQINLMTYNLSGPYPGWVVWHSGPLYNGGHRFPNGSANLPSADGLAEAFIAAGVPRSKLGVGLSFHGYVWSGGEVSRPRQGWRTAPAMKSVPYYALAQTYGIEEGGKNGPGYHWDAGAQAAYLSIEPAAPAEAQFVSYGNETTVAKTVQYARRKGIGGVILWDIGAGYRTDQPAGGRDRLLQAVKQARLGAPGETR